MFFSIIIPLYNRPEEIEELLDSLVAQTYTPFEVIVVEDGSTRDAQQVVAGFADRLDVHYYAKANAGQGYARNYGFARAKGDFFIVFDSDVLVPPDYLTIVKRAIEADQLDAFGGADAAHPSFSPIQKAISYAMTSVLTTGGIRGNKVHVGRFHPRSFNMGISRRVWEGTGGFLLSRRSEDIEFSIRMINQGYRVALIPEAYVYHKRRTDFEQFFRQTYNFGKGRVDIARLHPGEMKAVHLLPSAFVVGLAGLVLLNLVSFLTPVDTWVRRLTISGNVFVLLYAVSLFLHSLSQTKDRKVAALSVAASFVQLVAYGSGLISNALIRLATSR